MKTRLILFVSAVVLLLALAGLYRKRSGEEPLADKPRGDAAVRLAERMAALPAPGMTNLPKLASVPGTPAVVSATASFAGKVLDEAVLDHLRREFVPPRFTTDPALPREWQTLLSNRLLVSPAARVLPSRVSGRQSPTARNTTPFIVQFNRPVSAGTRRMLTGLGAIVRGFLPNNSILAEFTPAALAALADQPTVHAAVEFLPSDKVQPFLSYLAAAQPPEAFVRVMAQTFAPEDAEPVAEAMKAKSSSVESVTAGKDRGIVRAIVPLDALGGLAALGEVQWIEECPKLKTCNDKAAIASHLNVTNVWNLHGLTGRGQVVGHADTGLDTGVAETIHVDFTNRVRAIIARGRPDDASDIHGHGTHTAGSILGSGAASSGQFRGMAWEAELVHQSVLDANGYLTGIPNDLGELFGECYELGARLHSDSWGADTAGAYTIDCSTTDMFAWEHQDHLAVFSSGNAGRDSYSSGVIDLGSVGSPAAAKNAVAVGATENDRPSGSGGYSSSTWYNKWGTYYPVSPIRNDLISYSATTSPYRQGMAAFSSRGPTQDGRVKPDVVAPGTDVISTKSSVGLNGLWGYVVNHLTYRFCGGTSMAAPLVAGTAALMRQYAVERACVSNPSAALIKAMLVGGAHTLTPGQYGTNTTQEIPEISPNNVEGWGQPDVEAALFPAQGGIALLDRIEPGAGQTNTFYVSVTEPGQPLDIALVWVDYPATSGAGVTLVNDLDLLLAGPGGSVTYPNSGTAPDRVNTVETVRLAAAAPGVYQIKVIGAFVPYEGGAAAIYLRGTLAPVVTHTPPKAQVYGVTLTTELEIQPPGIVGTGNARLIWSAGNNSGPTGVWQETQAVAVTNFLYYADIPPQPPGVTVHYYYRVESEVADPVLLPHDAPAELFSVYFGERVDLSIEGSPVRYGEVTPPYGTNSVIDNTPFDVAAPAVVPISDGRRQLCAGWDGSGDIISQRGAVAGTLMIWQPSSLTWLWQEQYALTNRYRLADTGEIFGTSVTWHDENTEAHTETALELGFMGETPYAFCGWSVDGERWPAETGASPNPAVGILMYQPRLAQGDYLPFWQDSDSNGLSDWWELRYYGQASGGVAAGDDPDGDLWSNAAEFLDNTDPNDPASVPVPPQIIVAALDPFQSGHPPWTVQAEVIDNFTVDMAWLIWREKDDVAWQTNSMSFVAGDTFQATLTPPSHGVKRVDYFVVASDLLGYYMPTFRSESPVYSVIGDYDTPWLAVMPAEFETLELGEVGKNLTFTVANLAGEDLVWTARVAAAAATFAATAPGWMHSGKNDLWCVTTNRTWNGDEVWYCGNPVTRLYSNDCDAKLDTPEFRVGPGGGVLWRQWIESEYESGAYYWDGAVVWVSCDSGVTFELATPYGGYPFLITQNPASPFTADHPCLAGDGTGWQTLLLDLAAYAGQDVIVRFEFGSDSFENKEGWYLAGVTPFAFDEPTPPWLDCQGAWQGTLPDTWEAAVDLAILPEALIPHTEVVACIRVESNDPAPTPLLPVTVRRGHRLYVSSDGPGSAAADSYFLFREASVAVTMQADPGCYLYGVSINNAPLPGEYGYSIVSRTITLNNVSEDQHITAWFTPRLWTLNVETPYSTSDPAAGTHTMTENTIVEASVVSPLDDNGSGIRQQCSGWSLTGHSPTGGVSDHVTFTITNNATLTWRWNFAHRLLAVAGPDGRLEPDEGWYFAGTTVVITAYPSIYYHLDAWNGDIDDAGIDNNRLTVVIIQPRTVGASFKPNLTAARGVPEHWLAAHGWTQDFEAVAEGDQDTDGMYTWQEWLADTDPTDPLSLLSMTGLRFGPGGLALSWQGGIARTQELQRAAHPSGPWVTIHTNLPPTVLTNELWLPPAGGAGFYRVRVP